MDETTASPTTGPQPPVYIVSGATGSSGELLVHTALAQFVGCHAQIILMPRVREMAQLEEIVARASAHCGIVIHTLVDADLRDSLTRLGRAHGVPTIDLMGPLLRELSQLLGMVPVGQPGLYQQLNESYFKRVQAINFSMAHDDGLRTEDLPKAEIVILGVSRTGKTPLSMYLAVLGWRVANVPMIPGHTLPTELTQVERHRVVGLTIEPEQLATHRGLRQRDMRGTLPREYTGLREIQREIEDAEHLLRSRGFAVIDVTRKPIETTADEILNLVNTPSGE